MIQVIEFKHYQGMTAHKINEWVKEQGDSIEIIDIKYTADANLTSALIIYKVKK